MMEQLGLQSRKEAEEAELRAEGARRSGRGEMVVDVSADVPDPPPQVPNTPAATATPTPQPAPNTLPAPPPSTVAPSAAPTPPPSEAGESDGEESESEEDILARQVALAEMEDIAAA